MQAGALVQEAAVVEKPLGERLGVVRVGVDDFVGVPGNSRGRGAAAGFAAGRPFIGFGGGAGGQQQEAGDSGARQPSRLQVGSRHVSRILPPDPGLRRCPRSPYTFGTTRSGGALRAGCLDSRIIAIYFRERTRGRR